MAYKRPVGDRVFNMMQNVSNEKNVDMNNYSEIPKDRESIHNALMVAGMTPGIGNIADITDATLYALEGEFGDAAWSAAAAIPVIGQMVSGKKALKAAKEAGEEMVTLYRGVPDWFQGKMVKDGNFISPQNQKYYGETITLPSKKGIYVGDKIDVVEGYARKEYNFNPQTGKKAKPSILEFEVPKSWLNKKMLKDAEKGEYWIDGGLPKEFLKKVHK